MWSMRSVRSTVGCTFTFSLYMLNSTRYFQYAVRSTQYAVDGQYEMLGSDSSSQYAVDVPSTYGNDKTSTSASRGSPWCWDESLAENAVEGQDDKKMDYRGGHGVRGGFLKVEQQQTTEVCFRSRVSLNRDNRTTVEQR